MMHQGSSIKLAEWKEFALTRKRQSVRDTGGMNGVLSVLACGLLNHGLLRAGFANARSNHATITGNDSTIDCMYNQG